MTTNKPKSKRYEYFVHDARHGNRLDGPYSSRKAADTASVKFNKQGVPTVIEKVEK